MSVLGQVKKHTTSNELQGKSEKGKLKNWQHKTLLIETTHTKKQAYSWLGTGVINLVVKLYNTTMCMKVVYSPVILTKMG